MKIKKTDKERYSSESVREWALKMLMESAEAQIDISRCGDPEYLKSLSPVQNNKLKRVVYGKYGQVISMEPVSVVDFVVAAANIAGTREYAKKKAEEEKEKEQKNRYRSAELRLSVKSEKTGTEPESGKQDKSKSGQKKKNDNSAMEELLRSIKKT